MEQQRFDVAIAGYGPTGLTAVALLARRGHKVAVFERWPSLYGLPRVATIDGESARIIQAASDIDFALRNSEPRRALAIESDTGPTRNAWLTFDTTRKRTLPNIFGVSPDGRTAVIFCAPNGGSHSIIPMGKHHLRFNFEVDPAVNPKARLGAGLDRALAYRRRGRVFLAGDAAHVMTPFLGQGGCSAFRDAISLAWKLDLVLRGEARDTLLDTYEAERLPHVRVHVDGSDRAGALAFIADPVAATARDCTFTQSPAHIAPAA